MEKVIFKDLGLIDYQEAWDIQEQLFGDTIQHKIQLRNEERSDPTRNYLLFCEHPHVFTLGKSGDPKHLLLDQGALNQAEAKFYEINRGGDITYHGPGQLVAYPILDLDHFFTDIHRYMRTLEEAVIQTLKVYGIHGERFEGLTGVWLEPNTPKARKICALGVKCSRWVTMHGIGFNVNSDLSYFSHIVPCGIQDKSVTSMQAELGNAVDFTEVSQILKEQLALQFGFEYTNDENAPHVH
ncbi:MAG: lipoyl(octanoyl) transferase LipB [Bacteroidetes bacterium]|nr:MAG: lipoyl(octanoyl) transferase LipB [Bacteroidota bacterium]